MGVEVARSRVTDVDHEEGSSTTRRRELEAGDDLLGVPDMTSPLVRMRGLI